MSCPDDTQQKGGHGDSTGIGIKVVEIRPLSAGILLRRYLKELGGFLIVGLFAFVALWVAPAIPYDLFVWVFVSGLYLGVAANALAEDSSQRETVNSNRIASHFIGLVFPGAIGFLLWLPVVAMPRWFAIHQQWLAVAVWVGVILAGVFITGARLWPAYVTPWLFRGQGEQDLWRDTSRYNPMVTDWPIAWRLTGVPGAFRRAYVPVLVALMIGLGAWGCVAFYVQGHPWVLLLWNLVWLLVLVPVFELMVLDRAKALREAEAAREGMGAESARRVPHKLSEPAPSEAPLDQTLRGACLQGDAKRARELLSLGADPNHWTAAHQPLLMDRISTGRRDIVGILLRFGADPNQPDGSGRTALHAAALAQNIPVIQLLLTHGANASLPDKEGRTAFDDAAAFGADPAVLALLAEAAATEDDPQQVLALLESAIRNSDRTAVVKYVRHPALSGSLAQQGGLVSFAAAMGDVDIVRLLMEAGFSQDVPDRVGSYPIHAAARDGHIGVLKLLLEWGARTDLPSKSGDLPLQAALQSTSMNRTQKLAVARLLLEAGSPRSGQGSEGRSLRSEARKHGLFDLLDELPPEPGEPPVDPESRDVRAVRLYEDDRFRVSYYPNDIQYPFVIAEWEGRDGWMPQRYDASRRDELSGQLPRFDLQWFSPVIDRWAARRPMPLTAVLQLYRRHRGEAPVVESFDTPPE